MKNILVLVTTLLLPTFAFADLSREDFEMITLQNQKDIAVLKEEVKVLKEKVNAAKPCDCDCNCKSGWQCGPDGCKKVNVAPAVTQTDGEIYTDTNGQVRKRDVNGSTDWYARDVDGQRQWYRSVAVSNQSAPVSVGNCPGGVCNVPAPAYRYQAPAPVRYAPPPVQYAPAFNGGGCANGRCGFR